VAVTPDDILVLADNLSLQGNEAAWRSSVSRAYYACFHVARQVGRVQPKGHDSHAQVWSAIHLLSRTRPRPWDCINASKKGQALKARREQADYEIQSALSRQDCLDALALARKLIESLRRL